ncbi:MAG: general secretion pathway protein GspB [Xanthomonadales bacterium]|nr:general secretion pathway protein GspB [Xanthomonadales bacterium]
MSFILDALKKSEAERQLGEVPSLQSGSTVTATQSRSRSWPLPLFGVVLLAIVLGWFWGQSETNNVASGLTELTATTTAPVTDPPVEQTLPQVKLPETVRSPLTDYTPPAVIPTAAKIADSDTAENTQANAGQSTTATAPDQDVPATAVTAAANEQQRVARLKKQRAAELVEDQALVAAVEQRLANERATKAEIKKPVAQKNQANTVSLNDLPASVRADIPDIKITMQVYSEDPAARFAIVNGKRYKQTDQLADELILEQILRQGIILKFRQYLILID